MSNLNVYEVEKHFLMQVEETDSIKGIGLSATIWNWDVYIASKGETYFGMAEEKTKGTVIGWTELKDHDYLDEIKALVVQRSLDTFKNVKG
ncbi:hypothetical protein P4829_06530 [Bacillus atrophaeus]|uniref:hypothetical protein n=1 Tax=Bacillus atrophaeus TaxID=1452 RepID=UPI0007C5BD6B|nr:hypothetical protein [Bacillus atrophaeus]WFE15343.1 hypothetical protein P4829_06530 [Bacillus atrophaeus]